jgi:predicted metalloendopeptidase
LATSKTYLRWLVSANADYLSKVFVDEHFAFYRGYLRGVVSAAALEEVRGWVDCDLGEALGKEFVDRTFPPETRRRRWRRT